jgi:hypothetical protein
MYLVKDGNRIGLLNFEKQLSRLQLIFWERRKLCDNIVEASVIEFSKNIAFFFQDSSV